jgi:hypothetical protein
MMMTSTTTG